MDAGASALQCHPARDAIVPEQCGRDDVTAQLRQPPASRTMKFTRRRVPLSYDDARRIKFQAPARLALASARSRRSRAHPERSRIFCARASVAFVPLFVSVSVNRRCCARRASRLQSARVAESRNSPKGPKRECRVLEILREPSRARPGRAFLITSSRDY